MADSPKLSESSQALFCAVVDNLGKPINDRDRPANYPAFQRKYGKQLVMLIGMTLQMIHGWKVFISNKKNF